MNIDFTNPQVRENYLRSQMLEGKGEVLSEKREVRIFRDGTGAEHIITEEVYAEFLARQEAEKPKEEKKEVKKKKEVKEEKPKKKAGRPKKAEAKK